MRIDAWIPDPSADDIRGLARIDALASELEEAGYSGMAVSEISHDPFLPLALAARGSERLDLMTGIAVAFARSPLVLAHSAWDLQALSRGRFMLGLGSQVKPHITKRFSMAWSSPTARMRETIEAVRAIWRAWQTGERLDFRGRFYRHTLMTPAFSPEPLTVPPPPILLAAVGPLMARTAGVAADGMISHPFQTAEYFREITLPSIHSGLAESGRRRTDFQIAMPVLIVSGFRDAERAAQAEDVRRQIAFYGSTPAYRPVLEHHGWEDAQDELNPIVA